VKDPIRNDKKENNPKASITTTLTGSGNSKLHIIGINQKGTEKNEKQGYTQAGPKSEKTQKNNWPKSWAVGGNRTNSKGNQQPFK